MGICKNRAPAGAYLTDWPSRYNINVHIMYIDVHVDRTVDYGSVQVIEFTGDS